MTEYCVAYDMRKAPASYDFLQWLINTEMQRRQSVKSQAETIRNDPKRSEIGRLLVTFIAGPRGGFRDDGLARPIAARKSILANVMLPALKLIGAEAGGSQDFWPSPGYLIGEAVTRARAGEEIPRWTVPAEYMQAVREALNGRKPIVITLREADYYPERNSNLETWKAFARRCGEDVIFVRDTAKASEPLDGFETWPMASTTLLFRAALMAQAKANLMVANGPIAIAQYLDVPWLMFKPLVPELPDWKPGQPAWWERQVGIGVGGQLPWATKDQRIVWADDTLANIEQAWEALKSGEVPMPHNKTKAVLDEETRLANVRTNIAQVSARVEEATEPHDRTAIVACYGPSLKRSFSTIAMARASGDADVATVSGAHDFLVSKGIVPDIHIDCDPREHKGRMLNDPWPGVRYLLASCCHPSYVDKLIRFDLSLWHLWNGPESEAIMDEIEPGSWMLAGGASVGLRAVSLLYSMGYRRFAIHGMDCSFDEEGSHAAPHTGKPHHRAVVRCDGRQFTTSKAMIEYARQFLDTRHQLCDAEFQLHGDGLLQAMARVANESAAA